MCSRNPDAPRGKAEGRLSHDGSNSRKKEKRKKKADHHIQCKNCHQRVFSFMLSCTKRNYKKRYFPPFELVHRSPDRRARVCVKFKFLMTAQGKRKENNEIKPLPPDLGWDVTTCLFSPAPVFSQLSKFLCSYGSMIHLFRERKKKKKRREGGRKSSSFSSPASSTSGCRHSVCVCSVQKVTEKQRDMFSEK